MLKTVTMKDGRPAIIDTKPLPDTYLISCSINGGDFQPTRKSKIARSPQHKIGSLGIAMLAAANA